MKKICCFAAVMVMALTLLGVPVSAVDEVAETEAGEETVETVEPESVAEPEESHEGIWYPGDEGYDELLEESTGDPEFGKYYLIDEEGTILSRDAMNRMMIMSAATAGLTHQSRYKNVPQFDCIDVSKHQGTIDWSAVKAAGYDYVIIRAGHTWASNSKPLTPNQDPCFTSYIHGAYNAGLQVGVYYFSQALTEAEARTEAKTFVNWIAPYKSMITLPAVMDYETYNESGCRFTESVAKSRGKSQLTKNAQAFCEIVRGAGYEPMVYANKSFLKDRINASTLESSGYGIWLAHYTNSTDYTTTGFSIWQYSSSGKVSGISGNVDMNVIYGLGTWEKDEKGYKLVYLDGTTAKNTWSAVNGYPCYIGANGYRLTGMQTIGGVKYIFSSAGLGIPGKWYTISGKKYYTQAKGRVVTGYRKIGNYYYGFRADGSRYEGVTATIGKKKYRFLSDGRSVKYTAKIKYRINSRKGPSTRYKKAGKLKKNKKVVVVRTSGKWSQMSDGRWFMTKYRKSVYSYPRKVK